MTDSRPAKAPPSAPDPSGLPTPPPEPPTQPRGGEGPWRVRPDCGCCWCHDGYPEECCERFETE